MKRADEERLRQELREAIQAKGLRVTAPRMAVLLEIAKAKTPLTHHDIAALVERQGLDRVTVWRNLTALVEAELIRRTDIGDAVWRFERVDAAAHGDEPHPHFVCVDCGRSQCLGGDSVMLSPRAAHGSVVLEIQVKGRCVSCVARP